MLFIIMEDADEPALVVLVHSLVHDFLADSCYSQGMFESGLFPILSDRVTENFFVELDGS